VKPVSWHETPRSVCLPVNPHNVAMPRNTARGEKKNRKKLVFPDRETRVTLPGLAVRFEAELSGRATVPLPSAM
jgi:hypothetical protein